MLVGDPKLDNAVALAVLAGLGVTVLIGIGLRRRRRAAGDALMMVGCCRRFSSMCGGSGRRCWLLWSSSQEPSTSPRPGLSGYRH
jgi:hypothetical protein